jgi:hypothetical protein
VNGADASREDGGADGPRGNSRHEEQPMRRVSILSTPPPIAVGQESLSDGAAPDGSALNPADGLEIVPRWQARPALRRHRVWASAPVAVAAAALVVVVGHGAGAAHKRPERPALPSRPAGPALIVAASARVQPNSRATAR